MSYGYRLRCCRPRPPCVDLEAEKPAIRVHSCIAVLIIGLMSAMLLADAKSEARCTVDEPGWITSGYVTWQLVTDLAPPSQWTSAFSKVGPWGHQNPPVAKLIIGAATALAKSPEAPVEYMWQWPADYDQNLIAGNLPPPAMLAEVRTVISWFGIASLILVFLIAREVARPARWAPLLAPLLLFSYDSFRVHACRVYSDVPQMAFTLTGLWCLLLWRRRGSTWLLAGACVAWGLACGTKFSSGAQVAGGMFFVAIVSAPWWKRCLRILVAGAVPSAIFVAVNPYLWLHPLDNTVAIIRLWSAGIVHQQHDPVLAPLRVTERLRALHLTLSRVILSPSHGRQTPGFCGQVPRVLVALLVATAVAASVGAILRWRGRELCRRKLMFMFACAGAALGVALFADGASIAIAMLLVLGAWKVVQPGRGGFAVIYLATLVATVWWLPFDWPRYYLPLLGVTSVLGALGGAQIEAALPTRRLADRSRVAHDAIDI